MQFLFHHPGFAESSERFHTLVPTGELTKHGAIFALLNIKSYNKFTIIKIMGIVGKIGRPVEHSGVPQN